MLRSGRPGRPVDGRFTLLGEKKQTNKQKNDAVLLLLIHQTHQRSASQGDQRGKHLYS